MWSGTASKYSVSLGGDGNVPNLWQWLPNSVALLITTKLYALHGYMVCDILKIKQPHKVSSLVSGLLQTIRHREMS